MPPETRRFHDVLRYSHLGVQFVVLFAAGVFLGRWLDSRWGDSGLWTIAGTIAGFAAASYALIRETRDVRGEDKERGARP